MCRIELYFLLFDRLHVDNIPFNRNDAECFHSEECNHIFIHRRDSVPSFDSHATHLDGRYISNVEMEKKSRKQNNKINYFLYVGKYARVSQ